MTDRSHEILPVTESVALATQLRHQRRNLGGVGDHADVILRTHGCGTLVVEQRVGPSA